MSSVLFLLYALIVFAKLSKIFFIVSIVSGVFLTWYSVSSYVMWKNHQDAWQSYYETYAPSNMEGFMEGERRKHIRFLLRVFLCAAIGTVLLPTKEDTIIIAGVFVAHKFVKADTAERILGSIDRQLNAQDQ